MVVITQVLLTLSCVCETKQMQIPLVVFCFCSLPLCFLCFRFLNLMLLHVFLLFSWTNFFLLLFLFFFFYVCWASCRPQLTLAFLFLSLSAVLSSLEQFCFSLVAWNGWYLSSKLHRALYRKLTCYIFWVQLCRRWTTCWENLNN